MLNGQDPFPSLEEFHTVKALVPGHDYQFKYRGVNIFGLGEFSDPVTVKAATHPDQVVITE